MSKSDRLLDSSVCPGCGTGLRCGGYWGQTPISQRCEAPHPEGEPQAQRIWALTPKTKCWCFDFARVIDVPSSGSQPNATCLCPACLEKLIANQRP